MNKFLICYMDDRNLDKSIKKLKDFSSEIPSESITIDVCNENYINELSGFAKRNISNRNVIIFDARSIQDPSLYVKWANFLSDLPIKRDICGQELCNNEAIFVLLNTQMTRFDSFVPELFDTYDVCHSLDELDSKLGDQPVIDDHLVIDARPLLHSKTKLAKAIVSLLTRPDHKIDKNGHMSAVIFGGCALHLLTNKRGSLDVDAEINEVVGISRKDLIASFDEAETYIDDGRIRSLVYDHNFNTALCPLHVDYLERAIHFHESEGSKIRIYVAHPLDLATSKLGRFGERDIEDIQCLLDRHLINPHKFDKLAKEAIDYYVGDRQRVITNLNMVLERYLKRGLDYE